MNGFFKTFFASLLAFVVGNFIAILLFVLILAGIGAAMMSKQPVTVSPKTVLVIDFNQPISDNPDSDPMSAIDVVSLNVNHSLSLYSVVSAIDRAAGDSNIEGILISPSPYAKLGLAAVEEIRNALLRFKESGKFIFSYADGYSQGMYYLCSVSDAVALTKGGQLEWVGLASGATFYKGLLDMLGIEVEVFRHGEFKAAVEPFITDKMSPENRLQVETLLGTVWGDMLEKIAASRTRIDAVTLDRYASELAVIDPKDAEIKGMIDGRVSRDFIEPYIAMCVERGYNRNKDSEKVGGEDSLAVEIDGAVGASADSVNSALSESKAQGDTLKSRLYMTKNNKITLADYIHASSFGSIKAASSDNKVVVVYIEGQIIDGSKPQRGYVVGEVLASTLRELRDQKNVKAVVLRINSPGGSALASEVIWNEVFMLRQAKPVIVSMGNVAASGGYYIAAPADAILASPSTVTGSIGVFGLMLNGQKALKNKLGITVDIAKTNPSADMSTSVFGLGVRTLSSFERAKMQKSVEDIYQTFVGHVAQGRNMEAEQVHKIAEGRVWSGVSALEIGLIDGYGGLKEAIELAADRAGVAGDFRVEAASGVEDNISKVMRYISSEVRGEEYGGEMGTVFQEYQRLKTTLSTQGVQALMPYSLELE